jgi:hypothetical protein
MSSWRLAVVLDLAARRETEARRSLADALATEAACHAEQTAAADALASQRAREADAAGRARCGGACAGALGRAALHLDRLQAESTRHADAVRAASAALARAACDVADRRAALAGARAGVRVLEARRAAWSAARRTRREREDDRAVDDLLSGRCRGVP